MPGQTGGPAPAGAGGMGLGGIFDISQMATQAGQGAMGHLISGLFANSVDRRQYRNAEKLQNLQIVGQKHMMDYSYNKQLQMWKDTNYAAQVEQMKLAGINPGLLYGMSGGGATTTGSSGGPSPSGTPAHHSGAEQLAFASTMMELGTQRANRELIEAQTEKVRTETEKISGVDTKLGETQVQSLSQGIEESKAKTRLQDVETELKQLETKVSRDTLEERIDQIEWLARTAKQQYEILARNNKLEEAQYNDKINLLKNQIAESIVRQSVMNSEIKVNDAEITKMAEDIAQGWANIDTQNYEASLKAFEADIKAKYPGLWNVAGRILNETASGIGQLFGQRPDYKNIPRRK